MEVDQPSAKEQALTAYRDTIRKHRRLETQMRHGKKNTTTSTLLQLSGGERERASTWPNELLDSTAFSHSAGPPVPLFASPPSNRIEKTKFSNSIRLPYFSFSLFSFSQRMRPKHGNKRRWSRRSTINRRTT